jgi:hypothetical protein
MSGKVRTDFEHLAYIVHGGDCSIVFRPPDSGLTAKRKPMWVRTSTGRPALRVGDHSSRWPSPPASISLNGSRSPFAPC